MDLLHGGTLKAYLKAVHTVAKREHRRPGMPADQALNIVLAICFGVAALHERGVIHRDLKPDNVILHRDEEGGLVLKIIDYGIAHLETEGEYAAPAGTSTYAAAEHYLSGRVLTPKVDLFAIGVMMFEMLTGAAVRVLREELEGRGGAGRRRTAVAHGLPSRGSRGARSSSLSRCPHVPMYARP